MLYHYHPHQTQLSFPRLSPQPTAVKIAKVDDDDKDPTSALCSQLAFMSQRARRTIHRLVRPNCTLLTVSSPEVNEALEDTNTLIRFMKNITAPARDDCTTDPATNYGLAFSALACHQHLVALFRAICDAIHRCLQGMKEQQQQQQRQHHHQNHQYGILGPSSVAQFIMILQLLIHLINRMDRSLFQNNHNPSTWNGAGVGLSADGGGHITPISPNNMTNHHTIDPLLSDSTGAGGGASTGGAPDSRARHCGHNT